MNLHKILTVVIAYELLRGLPSMTLNNIEKMYDGNYNKFILTMSDFYNYNQAPIRKNDSWEILNIGSLKVFMSGNIDMVKFTYQANQWTTPEVIFIDGPIMEYNDYKHSNTVMNHVKDISDRIIKFLKEKNNGNSL